MPKVFLDTNVLVYGVDQADDRRREAAREILRSAVKDGPPVISTQVLQEFYVAATTRLGVVPMLAKSITRSFETMEIVQIDVDLIRDAIDLSILNTISFWDALIVSAAVAAECSQLYTEDLNHGQTIRGVKIVNPFREG